MNEFINVTINNQVYQFSKGITLEEISKNFQDNCEYPIVLARIGNSIKELNTPINKSCTIEFLDLTSREGSRAHISGLTFVAIYAVKSLYGPNDNICVQHSIDKGIYI